MGSCFMIALVAVLQTAPIQEGRAALLADDAEKLTAAATNDERFEALTALLRARNVPFAVEPFTLEKPVGREPRTEGRNIVVSIGDGDQTIVVGSHYDAARLPDGSLSRGAVDNAASSVILVRLAEILRTEKLPVRVRVVWFDMEELGLIGSERYVKAHASDRHAAMLNFDINAYGTTVLFGPSEHSGNAALRRTFVQTCAIEEVTCVGTPQMPPGDDRSFVKAGIPTISVGVLPAIEAHQLWLRLNAGQQAGLAEGTVPDILRTIHTPADTIEKLDEETMVRMLRFAAALVRSVARG
jgi:Zn-dependent M28 family amino/carboxypeptidase